MCPSDPQASFLPSKINECIKGLKLKANASYFS